MHKRHKDFILGIPNRRKPNKLFLEENQSNTKTIPIMEMNLNMREVCPPPQETLARVATLQRESDNPKISFFPWREKMCTNEK